MDKFRSRDHQLTSFYSFFPHTTPWRQQLRIMPPERDLEASLLRSMKRWPLHHSIEPVMAAEYRAEKNWRTRCATGNEDDHDFDYRTPPGQWQKWHMIDPDEFKMTSITSNECNQPADTREVATAPLNGSVHGGNLVTSETNWHTWCVTDIADDDHEYGTRSIGCDHQPKNLQWTAGMPQYRKPMAKLRDDFWVSIVTTTILLFERSAPIPVCMYT